MKKKPMTMILAAGAMLGAWAADTHGKVQLWAGGPYWAETNIGADEAWDYGYYFWWGDPVGYRRDRYAWVASDGSSSDFSFRSFDWRFFEKDFDTLQSEGWITADGVLAPEHDAAQIHWGGRWRMPTTQEMFSLSNNCDWTWTTTNGVSGYIVRGRGDYSAASIFLPAAGQADNTRLNWDGRYGGYWSSVPVASSYARLLEFETAIPGLNSNKDRGYGYPVRPVQVPTGSITISFNANGGSVSPSSGAYTPGETYGSLPPVTREGYTFAGWFTTATGGTQVVTTTIAPAVDITLYAHWVANQYTVTLDRQGGTYGTERVTATYDSAMPTIIVPRHPGHTFGGYYTGPNGNGTQYYTASGASVQNWNLTNATTLYAYWCDTHGKVQLWADGPYWAETNVGADEPWESGLYFWWGDTIGYRRENNAWVASDGSSFDFSFEARNVPTSGKDNATLLSEGWITSDGVLAPEYDAAQAYWSGRWRMPTEQELSDIYNNCDWTWTSTNGVKGYVVRGREDFADASIFIPAAGFGQKTYRYNVGSTGSFWASVPDKYDIENAEAIYFYSGYPSIFGYFRYNGYSVRPVQSAPTAYDIWAAANGVAGAWDATDANGVHNIFRYAFDKPTGTFTNPPLLSITFDGGQPIVLTPPLVNTNGYTFGLLAYDALTNANPSAFWLLSPDGTNAVPGNLPARFFRLGAAEGNIDDK